MLFLFNKSFGAKLSLRAERLKFAIYGKIRKLHRVVEIVGIEPTAYTLRTYRSTNWAISPFGKILLINSYQKKNIKTIQKVSLWYLVGTTGLEPVTFCMSSKRSNQLSYAPV